MSKELTTNKPKLDLVKTLRNLADGLEDGSIDEVKVTTSSNGKIEVIADSNQGNDRTILTEKKSPGYESSSVEVIKKSTPEERRKTVCLLKQEGLSQNEIAKRTNVSQKTISNDIKYLKENKECVKIPS